MILLILTVSLLLLFATFFYLLKQDIFSPVVVKVAVFGLSSVVALANIYNWGVDISSLTYLIIVSGLVFFGVGSYIGFKLMRSRRGVSDDIVFKIDIPRYHFRIMQLWIIASIAIYVYSMYSIVYEATGEFVLSNFFITYRDLITKNGVTPGLAVKLFEVVSMAISNLMLLVLATNYIQDKKINKNALIIVALYAILLFVSTSRIGFFYLLISIALFVYIVGSHKWLRTNYRELVKLSIISLFIVLFSFFGAGFLTGKSQVQKSLVDNISIYAGSSIPAFSEYLDDYTIRENDIFGRETLYGYNNLMKRLGLAPNAQQSRFLEFRQVGEMHKRTNVYTSQRRLINDYGLIGMYLIEFITGLLLTLFYCHLKTSKGRVKVFLVLVYSLILQAIAMSSIEEKLIVNALTVTTLMTIAIYWLFSRLYVKNNIDERD